MYRLLLFVCTVVAVQANIAAIHKCDSSDDNICTVTQVRVDPCKNPKTCVLKKGQPASISIDYTINFAAEKLKHDVSYNGVSFSELNHDACSFTSCPTTPGVANTLNYGLELNVKLPKGRYPVEWKIWDESNEKNLCCFQMTLKLVA